MQKGDISKFKMHRLGPGPAPGPPRPHVRGNLAQIDTSSPSRPSQNISMHRLFYLRGSEGYEVFTSARKGREQAGGRSSSGAAVWSFLSGSSDSSTCPGCVSRRRAFPLFYAA